MNITKDIFQIKKNIFVDVDAKAGYYQMTQKQKIDLWKIDWRTSNSGRVERDQFFGASPLNKIQQMWLEED